MKTILSLLVIMATASVIAHAQDAQKPKRYTFIDYAAPKSQDELLAEAAVVARVRIEAQAPAGTAKVNRLRPYGMIHTALIQEVLKGADSVRVGETIKVQQAAGHYEDNGYIVEIKGDEPLKIGAEYVLFLKKEGDGTYREVRGPLARLELTTTGVRAQELLGKLYTGAENDAVLAKLRSAVK
jgi:hypothetical protein